MSARAPKPLTFDQLSALRSQTERISAFLTARLRAHLSTLYPILNPSRVFGKHLGARESAPRADEAYAALLEKYREASGAPFDLRSDLGDDALSAMEHGIDVFPWEYTHDAGGKPITITSPVKWAVTYRSEYSLPQMRHLAATNTDRRTLSLQQFIVNAVGIQIVLARNAGVGQILDDLRYDAQVETGPGLGKVPLLTISSRLPSFRPADELILSATRLSGVPAFIELIDPDVVRNLHDPLRSKLEGILSE